MAIINSVFMGRAKKSAGNATFRTVRGRTIASMKIAKKGSQGSYKSLAQFAMAAISRFAAVKATDIALSFDKTTYGSSRNAFMKVNYDQLRLAVRSLWTASLQPSGNTFPSDAEIIAAIEAFAAANPNTIIRVRRAGYETKYLSGVWTSEDNPEYVEPDDGKASVSVSVNDTTMGSVTGGGRYDIDSVVTLTAVANSGYQFKQWSDDVTENPRSVVAVEGGVSYEAIFEAIPESEQIFIGTSVNDATMGSVSGMGTYAKGSSVILTATPNEGYKFVSWADDVTDNPRTVVADVNGVTYSAIFAAE